MHRVTHVFLCAIGLCWGLIVNAPSAAAAAPSPMVFDVGTLHVEQHGEQGSALILIPGLACGSWVWKDTIARLKRDHRVYAVTLAGFDGQPAVQGDVMALAADSLRELIASKRIDKPVLVGHSLGGTLALMFATVHSDAIAGVVTLDGLPVFPGTESLPAAQRPALAERLRGQLNRPRGEFEAQQLQYMRRVGVVSETHAADLARLASRSDPAATADYAARAIALDLRPQLHAIRVPVMALSPYLASDSMSSGSSESAKMELYRSLLQGTPALEVVSIPGARHFAMVDQPEAFHQALARFMGSVARP